MKIRPTAISLSPNTEFDDILEAIKSLADIKSFKKGKYLTILKDWFSKEFKEKNIFLFSSARSALFCILKSFNIGYGDEVIIQGFTCVAVPDPILWLGAKPVYCDIDESLNIDPGKLEKRISNKTRAIIVQHTFGVPAKIEMIKKITQKHRLILIEDCAHSLGAVYKDKKVGTFGDAAFFSFGRDKVVSSVFGGTCFIRKNKIAIKNLKNIYRSLPHPGIWWIFQQLLHPLFFLIILPLYDLYIGKIILFLLVKLGILSLPVEKIELSGGKPAFYPSLMPNALARLAFSQINKLERFNAKRREIAKYYFTELKSISLLKLPVYLKGAIYLRFNILVEERDEFYGFFKRKNILLGKWYSNTIDPKGVEFNRVGYKFGMAPNSEKIARLSLNLPTYPTLAENEKEKIVELIKKYANKRNQ